jgi:hypothetical protein
MNLIAKSCFCPGLISLLSNLIKSFEDNQNSLFVDQWLSEYKVGLEHEIYRVELNNNFAGFKFITMAGLVYE